MTPRVVRLVVFAVFVAGIVGMIVGSIADSNGAAITFGLFTAVAALCLILVTSVTGPPRDAPPVAFDDSTAADLEADIAALVSSGAGEEEVRDLVRKAVRLGASARRE